MKNQKGFAILEVGLLVLLVSLIGFVGWYVISVNKKSNSKNVSSDTVKATTATNPISVKPQTDNSKVDELSKTEIGKLKATTPTKTSTSGLANPTASNPPAAPSKPAETGSIGISSDGCTISVVGTAGLKLEAGAFSATKGGSVEFTIPTSGSLSTSSGGFQNMTAYGKLTNANGSQIAYNSATITATSCPAAG